MLDAARTPWTAVGAYLESEALPVAVLPFGALEQHGPHLPLGTDTFQAESVATSLASEIGAVLLPAIPFGDTWNNAGYPGTVGIGGATVTAIATDLGNSLAASGFKAFVIVNGDWGNRSPLMTAARQLTADGVIPTIVLDYPGLDEIAEQIRETEAAAPGLLHADEIETSMMLSIEPMLVHRELAEAHYPELPADYGIAPHQLHHFSATGVFGDPTAASTVKGDRIVHGVVEHSVRIVSAFLARIGEEGSR